VTAAPALEVAELEAPFGAEPGLVGVSFAVSSGERLVVVGGSGAGKTTLLRAIAGLRPLRAGRVRIAGRDVSGEPPERRDAVYLHQTPLLFPHLSVAANVAFPLRVRGVTAEETARRVRDALAAVRLDAFGPRTPRTLSGGQRHRVALARAVVARPAVLLLDEPLSALDPALREEVRASLLALQRAYQPALVIVTHDLDEAGLLADRIAVLLDGRIAQIGTPGDLFARPASVAIARFLGVPNLVPGVIRGGTTFESVLGHLPLDGAALPSGPCTAAFRADAARITPAGEARGVVVAIRHRPRDTAVQVDIAGTILEVAADPPTPDIGMPVSVLVDPQRCSFLTG
jgi:ABC-type sugar transport system ATPase subunit